MLLTKDSEDEELAAELAWETEVPSTVNVDTDVVPLGKKVIDVDVFPNGATMIQNLCNSLRSRESDLPELDTGLLETDTDAKVDEPDMTVTDRVE